MAIQMIHSTNNGIEMKKENVHCSKFLKKYFSFQFFLIEKRFKLNKKNKMFRNQGLKALKCCVKKEETRKKIEEKVYTKLTNKEEEKNEEDLNPEIYFWCIYQVIGLILSSGITAAYNEVKKDKIGWNAEVYRETSLRTQEIEEYLVHPFDISEGLNECNKCGSKKTWSFSKQTRSADEPTTTFCKCVMCGNSWIYSG